MIWTSHSEILARSMGLMLAVAPFVLLACERKTEPAAMVSTE